MLPRRLPIAPQRDVNARSSTALAVLNGFMWSCRLDCRTWQVAAQRLLPAHAMLSAQRGATHFPAASSFIDLGGTFLTWYDRPEFLWIHRPGGHRPSASVRGRWHTLEYTALCSHRPIRRCAPCQRARVRGCEAGRTANALLEQPVVDIESQHGADTLAVLA